MKHEGIKSVFIVEAGYIDTLMLVGEMGIAAAAANQDGRSIGRIGVGLEVLYIRRLLVIRKTVDSHLLGGGIEVYFLLGKHGKGDQEVNNQGERSHNMRVKDLKLRV